VAVVVIVAGAAFYLWHTNNALVLANMKAKEAWSDVTVQLKRRADLIPNLQDAVKGYMSHESGTLTALTNARDELLAAAGPVEAAVAHDHLQAALQGVTAVAEAYPQLSASQNFLQLQDQLVDTEDKIQASRRLYNGAVRALNTRIEVFPNTLFTRRLGFTPLEFFDATDDTESPSPPTISFTNPTENDASDSH